MSAELIKKSWQTETYTAKYLAYKFDLTVNTVRSIVRGLNGPKKEPCSLSEFHRRIGMKLIDKRLASGLGIKDFAITCNMTHHRLRELEKGHDEITISELIRTETLHYAALLDAALLENE